MARVAPDFDLTTEDVMDRLGVKRATLYAYVSRGYLRSSRGEDGRSRYRSEDVERLSNRSRPRLEPYWLSAPSLITSVDEDAIRFRGLDAIELAGARTFEEAAMWLWTGSSAPADDWTSEQSALEVGRAVQRALPPGCLPLDRLRVTAGAIAATDALRYETRSGAVIVTAGRLISTLVDCMPFSGEAVSGGRISTRLWTALGGDRPDPEQSSLLDSVLVLLLDHELSMSTVAARVAASIDADPYAVVSVGLHSLGGPLQAVASLAAEDLLAETETPGRAPDTIGDRLRRGDRVPGLGHRLHATGDPRARFVIDGMRRVFPAEKLAVMEAILAAAGERGLPQANIDLALAGLVRGAGMVRGASEAIFAVARSAGWIAHALEVYGSGTESTRSITPGLRIGPER